MSKAVKILKRFGYKGQFVRYPNKWHRRIQATGKNRFDTSCDLLVGMCACGERHTRLEGWVVDCLDHYHARIETHEEWLERTRQSTISVVELSRGGVMQKLHDMIVERIESQIRDERFEPYIPPEELEWMVELRLGAVADWLVKETAVAVAGAESSH